MIKIFFAGWLARSFIIFRRFRERFRRERTGHRFWSIKNRKTWWSIRDKRIDGSFQDSVVPLPFRMGNHSESLCSPYLKLPFRFSIIDRALTLFLLSLSCSRCVSLGVVSRCAAKNYHLPSCLRGFVDTTAYYIKTACSLLRFAITRIAINVSTDMYVLWLNTLSLYLFIRDDDCRKEEREERFSNFSVSLSPRHFMLIIFARSSWEHPLDT